MKLNKIFEKNQEWIQKKLASDKDYFKNLSKGQNPEILYIGCSDSRVTAEEMMGVEPGDVFVHRNIANMVIATDLNSMSVVNYAIRNLHVKHVVVCGHYGCGGIKAAMQSEDLGLLNPWLRSIRDVYRLHREELNGLKDEESRYKRLVELNVQEQSINLMKTAALQKAYRNDGLKVHGWVFDMASGKLIDLNLDFDQILEEIREIYHLD